MKFTLILASIVAAVSAQSTVTAAVGCPTGAPGDVQVTRSNVPAGESTACPTLLAIYSSTTIPVGGGSVTSGGAASTSKATAAPSQFTGAANHLAAGPVVGLVAIVAGLLI